MNNKCAKCNYKINGIRLLASEAFPCKCPSCGCICFKKFRLTGLSLNFLIIVAPLAVIYSISQQFKIFYLVCVFIAGVCIAALIDISTSSLTCLSKDEFDQFSKKKNIRFLIGLSLVCLFVYWSVNR